MKEGDTQVAKQKKMVRTMSATGDLERSSANPRGRVKDQVQVVGRPPRNRQKSRKRVVQRNKASVKDDRSQLTSLEVGEARLPQRGVRNEVGTQ